jgi:hypothetical protein
MGSESRWNYIADFFESAFYAGKILLRIFVKLLIGNYASVEYENLVQELIGILPRRITMIYKTDEKNAIRT